MDLNQVANAAGCFGFYTGTSTTTTQLHLYYLCQVLNYTWTKNALSTDAAASTKSENQLTERTRSWAGIYVMWQKLFPAGGSGSGGCRR